MINIITKPLHFDNELKKKIEFVCSFCNTTPKIINGNIRKINKTNLSYIEPHRVIIKEITFLVFNYSKTIYVGSLVKELDNKSKEIKDIITNLKQQPLNKNNSVISNENKEVLLNYIEDVNKSKKKVRDIAKFTIAIEDVREDLDDN